MVNVGRYTIHGCYGYTHNGYFFHHFTQSSPGGYFIHQGSDAWECCILKKHIKTDHTPKKHLFRKYHALRIRYICYIVMSFQKSMGFNPHEPTRKQAAKKLGMWLDLRFLRHEFFVGWKPGWPFGKGHPRVCHLPPTWSGWTHGSDRNGNDRDRNRWGYNSPIEGTTCNLPETQMGPLVLLEVWALFWRVQPPK